MSATFPTPRTEDETVDHLHAMHGLLVANLDEWHRFFPNGRLPSSEHDAAHKAKLPTARGHRHAIIWAAP